MVEICPVKPLPNLTPLRLAVSFIVLCSVIFAEFALAHAPEQSNVFLSIEEGTVTGRIEVTVKDLNAALALDMKTGQSATLDDIDLHIDKIRIYVAERVKIAIGSMSGPPPFTDFTILKLSFASFVQLNFAFEELPAAPRQIDVSYSVLFDIEPNHRGMLVVESDWKSGTLQNEANATAIFEPGRERHTIDLSSSSVFSGIAAMAGLGMHHIWIGIDHILFLIALLLPAVVYRSDFKWQPVEGFRPALIHVVKVVTVFTVAHTITLSLAALNAITLSSRLVESIIAISIAIAALHIIVPIFRGRIWWIVFVFGLFHGFGFASVLGELGIPRSYLAYSLFGFNVGVEIGQIAIVAAVFPILYFLRRHRLYRTYILPSSAALLIVVSLYWFTERAFLVDLPAGAVVNYLLGWDA